MHQWNRVLLATLIVSSVSLVLLQQTASQETKQEDADKAYEEARRYLLEKKFATEERIEQAVERQGKEAVVRFARGKGWKGGSDTTQPPPVRKGKANPSGGRESVGLTPLCDLGDGKYKEQPGGLYPGGKNTPPEAHLKAALAEATKIRPLDADGKPADDGKIVMISNGMSNTTQEFRTFVQSVNRDRGRASPLVIVDCAQGGMEASMWAYPEKVKERMRPSPWDEQDKRLSDAGVSPKQVQVVWIKQARAVPAPLGDFPKHAEVLKQDLVVVLNRLKERFPNLRLAYVSSRIYAGYAGSNLNPEPYAYEGAFSVRWLIEDQIGGKPELNYDPARGEVKAPLILWGPYLWADGTRGRKTDDLVWQREDLARDGTHPSDSGRAKVAGQLMKFFKSDPTARPWFLTSSTPTGKTEPALPSRWAGTWQAADGEHGGELRCVALHVEGDRWEATFSGYCNRQFVYEVKMQGRQVGETINFTGKADLGDKDGGIYTWMGELANDRFKGSYRSASGKTGSFEMKPATQADK